MKTQPSSISGLSPYNINTIMILIVACIVSFSLVSCGGSSTGTDGNDNGDNTGGDVNNNNKPTFANVQSILKSSCNGSGCHIGETTNGVRLDSYDNVINSTGSQYGKNVIQPNDADNSPLVDKISNSNPKFGVRMPKGGSPLSSDRIDLIKKWINDGAKNN